MSASKLIGSRPNEQRPWDADCYDAPKLWFWEEPITNSGPDLLTVARELTELGYTVYIATPNGKRLVRRDRALSVSISSGFNWFTPTVGEGETPALDTRRLHELTARGAMDDGESLVLFDPAEITRIRRRLELAAGAPDGRLPTADLASFAELIELVDEVPPDLEPVRELATAIVSGTEPFAPRTPADLTAAGTIEQKVLDLQEQKRALAAEAELLALFER